MPREKKKDIQKMQPLKHDLAFMSLVDVQIDIEAAENPSDSSLTYDIFITPPERLEDQRFRFRCELAVGRKKAEQDHNFIEISASYGCIVYAEDAQEEGYAGLAQRYAATSVWSSFASLIAVVSNQMKVEFPPLPPSPGEVETRAIEEEDPENEGSLIK